MKACAEPPAEARQGGCHLYFPRKKRFCSFPAKPGEKYCHTHRYLDPSVSQEKKRIPCPVDGSHSIYEADLRNHVQRCASLRKGRDTTAAYYSKGLNAGDCSVSEANDPVEDASSGKASRGGALLAAMAPEGVADLVAKVMKVWEEHCGQVPTTILHHESAEAPDRFTPGEQHKHLSQHSSIIGHLHRVGLLSPALVYVEFGAGKGTLSHYIRAANAGQSAHVLIDRKNFRQKADRWNQRDRDGALWHRVLLDIRDVDLPKLPYVQDGRTVVAVSKHLCGCATDITLRCLASSFTQPTPPFHSPVAPPVLPSPSSSHLPSPLSPTPSMAPPGRPTSAAPDLPVQAATAAAAAMPEVAHIGSKRHRSDVPLSDTDAKHPNRIPAGASSSGEPFIAATDTAICSSPSASSGACGGDQAAGASPQSGSAGCEARFGGVVIATCCHHVCNWSTFVNRDWVQSLGFSRDHFDMLCAMTSWAVCGKRPDAAENPAWWNVPGLDRSIVGRRCKDVLDIARVKYLASVGLHPHMVRYIDSEVSPENSLIVALAQPLQSPCP